MYHSRGVVYRQKRLFFGGTHHPIIIPVHGWLLCGFAPTWIHLKPDPLWPTFRRQSSAVRRVALFWFNFFFFFFFGFGHFHRQVCLWSWAMLAYEWPSGIQLSSILLTCALLVVFIGALSSNILKLIAKRSDRFCLAIFAKSPVVFVTAHPDDECMFFGPTVAAAVRQAGGANVHLLCLSAGMAFFFFFFNFEISMLELPPMTLCYRCYTYMQQ